MEIIFSLLQGLSSSLFTTLSYIPAALGFYIALRCLKFPDLTVEGSFVFGQVVIAVFIGKDLNIFFGLIIVLLGGFFLGLLTGIQHKFLKIPSLVSGIVTTFFITTFNYKFLQSLVIPPVNPQDYQSEISSSNLNRSGLFEWFYKQDFLLSNFWGELRIFQILFLFTICIIIFLIVLWLLNTKQGLLLRAFGVHQHVASIYSDRSDNYLIIGLGLSNCLVAFSGAIFTQANRLVSIEFGATLLIPLIAAVIIGEFLVDFFIPVMVKKFRKRKIHEKRNPLLSKPLALTAAPMLGFLAYNILFILIATLIIPNFSQNVLNVSTYYKYALTAIIIVLFLWARKNDENYNPHPEDVI